MPLEYLSDDVTQRGCDYTEPAILWLFCLRDKRPPRGYHHLGSREGREGIEDDNDAEQHNETNSRDVACATVKMF